MSIYNYRALQSDGMIAEGELDAGGRQEAFRQLENRGLTPLNLAEGKTGSSGSTGLPRIEWKRKRVPFSALENFTRQLSSLLSAGISLSRALKILFREASVPAAKEQWKSVHDAVIDGASLADAMAQFPETFPRVYVAMIQAGETGGFLDLVLGQIADFQNREKELKSKVLSALIYPIILLALAIGVLIFLLVFFIPRFQVMFEDFGASLPLLTRSIVAVSEVMTQYGIFVVILFIAGIIILNKWLKTEQGRRSWQRLVLRLPVIGPLNARFAMTRFCRMLGTLVGSGVPLINALRVARESIGNQTLVDAVTNSIERVKQGDSLAKSLSDCPDLFPGSVIEIISIAEETGRLDKELVRLATVTDSELDRRLRTSVSLAEPLLLFLMAGFIGIIFVGMVLPIFTMQDYIK